jgi:hypothetical protein
MIILKTSFQRSKHFFTHNVFMAFFLAEGSLFYFTKKFLPDGFTWVSWKG